MLIGNKRSCRIYDLLVNAIWLNVISVSKKDITIIVESTIGYIHSISMRNHSF